MPSLEDAYEEYARFGFGDRYRLLDATATAEKVRIAGAIRGLYTDAAAVVHPGRLVRGLARHVEALGVTIHEDTAVTAFRPRDATGRAALVTARGEVRAPVVVLAGEAYLAELPALHRQLIPVWSLIVLTEPVSDAAWAEIGWAQREVVASTRMSIDYLSRTEDGRILFGGRGAPYRYGSPIRPEYDRHGPTHERLKGFVREWFPMLRDISFTHEWGGPLGMPRDWHPTMAFDPRTGIATARGYIGHGVSTTNLAGRVLTDLITATPEPADVPAGRQPPVPELGGRAVPMARRSLRAVGRGPARCHGGAHRQAALRPQPRGAPRRPLIAPPARCGRDLRNLAARGRGGYSPDRGGTPGDGKPGRAAPRGSWSWA